MMGTRDGHPHRTEIENAKLPTSPALASSICTLTWDDHTPKMRGGEWNCSQRLQNLNYLGSIPDIPSRDKEDQCDWATKPCWRLVSLWNAITLNDEHRRRAIELGTCGYLLSPNCLLFWMRLISCENSMSLKFLLIRIANTNTCTRGVDWIPAAISRW